MFNILISDYLTCSSCKETYTGIFKIDLNGNFHCIDCKNKQKYVEPVIETNVEELEQEMYLNYLSDDLQFLCPIVFNIEDLNLDMFLTKEGDIDVYKMYFQGNDLKMCIKFRELAYYCMDYLDTNLEEYLEFANMVIKKYIDLRFIKLDEAQVLEYMEIENDIKMNRILKIIEEV